MSNERERERKCYKTFSPRSVKIWGGNPLPSTGIKVNWFKKNSNWTFDIQSNQHSWRVFNTVGRFFQDFRDDFHRDCLIRRRATTISQIILAFWNGSFDFCEWRQIGDSWVNFPRILQQRSLREILGESFFWIHKKSPAALTSDSAPGTPTNHIESIWFQGKHQSTEG